ncbi:MAG: S24/S26 family peptidase [Myxococcales bacterium]|nr:S24/S26 family peptidase [Myxococcales bacterium]
MSEDALGAWLRAELAAGRRVRFVARGRSMWPFVLDGDRLTMAPLDGPPRLGEIVWVAAGDFGFTHRVIGRFGRRLWVKGDGEALPDGWFATDRVLARVVAIERGGRCIARPDGLVPVALSALQAAARVIARGVRGRPPL